MKKILIVAAAALLSACASNPTPYQPYAKSGGGGYTETKIEDNRVRLSFKGNTQTDRETVETYMLYRAAEVTLANGFDYFMVSDRATDKNQRTYGNYYGDPYFDYFPMRYRYYDPYWGGPFWGGGGRSYDTTTVTNYEASSEIVMFKGQKPADKPEAFDAREVEKNLSIRVQRPVPKS